MKTKATDVFVACFDVMKSSEAEKAKEAVVSQAGPVADFTGYPYFLNLPTLLAKEKPVVRMSCLAEGVEWFKSPARCKPKPTEDDSLSDLHALALHWEELDMVSASQGLSHLWFR